MKKLITLLAVFACLILAGSGNAETPKKTAKSKATKVLEVTRVAVSYLKSNPPQLKIDADGKTNTTGWSKPALIEHIYIKPPADGIYDYDFVATPPAGISQPVITPISATTIRKTIPKEMKGVRIIASKNKKVAKVHP